MGQQAKHSVPPLDLMLGWSVNKAVSLTMLCWPGLLQVRDNVEAVLQGLGLVPCPLAAQEAAALAEAQRILEPVQGVSWPSGLPENT